MSSDTKTICEGEIEHYKQCLGIVKGMVIEEAFYRGCICSLEVLIQLLRNKGKDKKMRKVGELKKFLENKEMAFVELDNAMVKNGFYSVLDDGIVEDIKRDRSVIYTGKETGECEIRIDFEISIDSGDGEGSESFCLRVTSVETF